MHSERALDLSATQQLALAHVFVSNKPKNLSCQEFAEELRAARTDSYTDPSNLDCDTGNRTRPPISSARFWRCRAERNLETRLELEIEIESLQKQKADLQCKVEAYEARSTMSEEMAKTGTKRKRPSTNKQTQTAASQKLPIEHHLDEDADVTQVKQPKKANQALLAMVYNLQRLKSSISTQVGINNIIQAIKRYADLLRSIIGTSLRSDDAQAFKSALALLFHTIKTTDADKGTISTANVVYSLSQLFRAMLERLWACCTASNAPSNPQERLIINPHVTGTRIQWRETSKSFQDLGTSNDIVRTFVAFLVSHSASATVAQLSEGVLWLLLQQAGPLMFAITFDASSADSCTKSIEQQIRSGSFDISPLTTNTTRSSLDCKAKVLMPLIKQALSAYLMDPRCRQTFTSGTVTSRGIEPDLVWKEKLKIQETLRTAIWGEHDTAFGEPIKTAKEVLHMMDQEDQATMGDSGQEPDSRSGGAWFVEDLWSLIGWDVMAQCWSDPVKV